MNISYFLLKNKDKKMTLQVWLYSAWYRLLIKVCEPKKLRKYWGISGEESVEDVTRDEYLYANRVKTHVSVSCSHTPWESKCLVQAWTAMTLLKKKGIPTTMYLGVGKENEKMIAHAWIRCGRMYVTGGDGSGYAIVAKYRN